MTAPTAKRATLSLAKAPAEAPARPVEPVSVTRIKGESDAHFLARCASIHALGVNYWQHPLYGHPPRHSRNPEVWMPARAEYLAAIAQAAADDRSRNPVALMQRQILNAMGK